MDSRELTEWGQLFKLRNEEFEQTRDGEVIEHGRRPDEDFGEVDDDDDSEEEDDDIPEDDG